MPVLLCCAVQLLLTLLMLLQTSGTSRMLREEVTESDVAEVINEWTGIPVECIIDLMHALLSDATVGRQASPQQRERTLMTTQVPRMT